LFLGFFLSYIARILDYGEIFRDIYRNILSAGISASGDIDCDTTTRNAIAAMNLFRIV
jgi:hypothetical protein